MGRFSCVSFDLAKFALFTEVKTPVVYASCPFPVDLT